MSVWKEAGYITREIQNQSVPIFNDAGDFGVPIYSLEDSIIQQTGWMVDYYRCAVVKDRKNGTSKIILDTEGTGYQEAGFNYAEFTYVKLQDSLKKHPSLLHKGIIGFLYVYTRN